MQLSSQTEFTESNPNAERDPMSESYPIIDRSESSIDDFLLNRRNPLYPTIRYGTADNTQIPELQPLRDPIPESATTVSPIYLLTKDQLDRQEKIHNPYAISGSRNIALELQNECESIGRVLYPIYVESDGIEEGISFSTIISEISEFIESWLNVSLVGCRLYYSGNRSIHAHLPNFVNEANRQRLKQLACEFNEDHGGHLDVGIYSRKRQFRLPGVSHKKTNLPKVEIEPEWSKEEIFRHATAASTSPPNTYLEYLYDHLPLRYTAKTAIQEVVEGEVPSISYLNTLLSSEGALLTLSEAQSSGIEIPTFELPHKPDDPAKQNLWKQYNRHPFSPYANADADEVRSVAVVRVTGGAFSRRGDGFVGTFLPCFIYGAVGGDGAYLIAGEYGRLRLSERDFKKRDYNVGDRLAFLGGRSRSSRILELSPTVARRVADVLCEGDDRRVAAIAELEKNGHDVGTSGRADGSAGFCSDRASNASCVPPAKTEAHRLQTRAETDGIDSLSWVEQRRIANRLLRIRGWDRTWDWFRDQFGDDFDPAITHSQLKNIITYYGDFPEVNSQKSHPDNIEI